MLMFAFSKMTLVPQYSVTVACLYLHKVLYSTALSVVLSEFVTFDLMMVVFEEIGDHSDSDPVDKKTIQ